jgi:hypothetical protein
MPGDFHPFGVNNDKIMIWNAVHRAVAKLNEMMGLRN